MSCGENPHEHPDPRGPQRQQHAVLSHSGLYACRMTARIRTITGSPSPDSTEPYEMHRRDVPENSDIRFRPLS